MKQAVMLLTNRTDYAVRERYHKLVTDYGRKADVFLLFDKSAYMCDDELSGFERVYTFSVQGLLEDGYSALESGFLGNCHYPLLKFHRDYPEYDYCWVVENDVLFSGDWSVLFETFSDDPADLVAAYIRKYEDDPNWYWWSSVRAPRGIALSRNELYASFNPVNRLSAKALECLETEMRNGWRGHFESVVPTVLAKHGMALRDIGGTGRFVRNKDEHMFYTEETHTWLPLRVQPIRPNMIYHPVKEKIIHKSYRNNCLISIVGTRSYYRLWMTSGMKRNYDIHLIVCDKSFGQHYEGTDFVYGKMGGKIELLKDYFDNHKDYLEQYDYFLLIDETSRMTVRQINALFEKMREESSEFSLVGITMPCFSQEMMKQLMTDDPEDSIIFF